VTVASPHKSEGRFLAPLSGGPTLINVEGNGIDVVTWSFSQAVLTVALSGAGFTVNGAQVDSASVIDGTVVTPVQTAPNAGDPYTFSAASASVVTSAGPVTSSRSGTLQ